MLGKRWGLIYKWIICFFYSLIVYFWKVYGGMLEVVF